MNDAKNIIHRPAAFNGVHPAKITKARMVQIIDELERDIDFERTWKKQARSNVTALMTGINQAKSTLATARNIAQAATEAWEFQADTVSDREWSLIRVIESLYSSMCAADRELDGEG